MIFQPRRCRWLPVCFGGVQFDQSFWAVCLFCQPGQVESSVPRPLAGRVAFVLVIR